MTRNVLIDVEHGRRGVLFERMSGIAEALDVRVGDLFDDLDGVEANATSPDAPTYGANGPDRVLRTVQFKASDPLQCVWRSASGAGDAP